MGAATGLVGVLGALARGAGAAGFGAACRSTGLAGSPVPTNFGRASDAKGFCGEQSVRRASWVMSVCSQEPHVGPGEAEGAPGLERCSDALGQHGTHGGPLGLTSGGKGLGVGLRGCCWSAMACRVISRACRELG